MTTRRNFIFAGMAMVLARVVNAGPSGLPPKKPITAPPPKRPKAAIVIDVDNWQVLYQNNADLQVDPASLVKLMTMYAVLHSKLDLNRPIPVSPDAARLTFRLGLRAKQKIIPLDAFRAMIGPSANDAAVAVAEGVAGSEIEFAKLMNTLAAKLGMTETFFTNASGLEDTRQKTTVGDMAKLMNALRVDFPEHYGLFLDPAFFDKKGWNFNNKNLFSHNSILHGTNPQPGNNPDPSKEKAYQGTDGGKTGYFANAGCNMVATAERDGRRLIVVVIGEDSGVARDREVRRLFNLGFDSPVPAPPANPVPQRAELLKEPA